MPTEKTIHSHHLSELSEKDREVVLDKVMGIIKPLCPGCRLVLLGYITGYAVKEIIPEQRMEYVKDIIKATMQVARDMDEIDEEEVNATRH